MGAIYLHRISEQLFGKRLVDALEIIAERDNHPLIFHCSAGKDRTGVLAAVVLAAIGIVDEDVSTTTLSQLRSCGRSGTG